jgi:adenylosuccinate lyase
MRANLDSLGGVVYSGEVLLALTAAGIPREDAYKIVQRNAMATWTRLGKTGGRDFLANLLADPEVKNYISPDKLKAAFSPERHLARIDHIFERVLG